MDNNRRNNRLARANLSSFIPQNRQNIWERPMTPSEAFANNPFPVDEVLEQYRRLTPETLGEGSQWRDPIEEARSSLNRPFLSFPQLESRHVHVHESREPFNNYLESIRGFNYQEEDGYMDESGDYYLDRPIVINPTGETSFRQDNLILKKYNNSNDVDGWGLGYILIPTNNSLNWGDQFDSTNTLEQIRSLMKENFNVNLHNTLHLNIDHIASSNDFFELLTLKDVNNCVVSFYSKGKTFQEIYEITLQLNSIIQSYEQY